MNARDTRVSVAIRMRTDEALEREAVLSLYRYTFSMGKGSETNLVTRGVVLEDAITMTQI